jgi:Flp pilus assembly protein TadD
MLPTKFLSFSARSLTLGAVNVTTNTHGDHQKFHERRFMRRMRVANYFLILWVALFIGCQPAGPRSLLDGERLIREGKYPQAIKKLQNATKLLPTNAQAWNHLGLAYQYAGAPAEALQAYQQAVALDRNSAAIRFNLGTLHLEQNRVNEAISELTTATVLDPTSLPAFVNLGKAQLRARRIDEAERSFQTVRRADPKNVEALNFEGVVNLHRRKAREATAFFNEALRLQPDYSPAVLNQAVLYHYYIVNKTNALARYRDYLAMKPDAAGAAAATEAIRVLEAELHPKPVVIATPNLPPATNRASIQTNTPAAPTNIVHAAPTNVAPAVQPTNKAPIQVAVAPKTNAPPPV